MARRFLIWFWSGGGGGSQFAVRLAHRLALRFGAENVTISLRADDPTIAFAERRNLDIRRAGVVSARTRPIATLRGLQRSAKVLADHARDADIVILPMNFAAAAPLSLGLDKTLIYCAHDPAPHPGDYGAVAQSATQAWLLHRATRVVALSNYAASRLQRVSNKLRVAPLASVFEPAAASTVAQAPTRLLFAGRMIAYKGLDVLAAALDLLAMRGDWRLTVAGEGPALTEALRQRLMRPNVDVRRAWLSDDALDALIAQHDILLAPYRGASQSGIVAQAMAAGRPCVATPVGALPEQIGAAGWLASAATPAAFAQALAAALDDPARAQKAAAARAQAHAAWTDSSWDWLRDDAL